jgi:hypothetical protein
MAAFQFRGRHPRPSLWWNKMVKCECCDQDSSSTKIYKLSLDEGSVEKRVCTSCFSYLMDASKAIRVQSGQIAWGIATNQTALFDVLGIELWRVVEGDI